MDFWTHGIAISLIISVINKREFMYVGERIKNRRVNYSLLKAGASCFNEGLISNDV